MTPSSRRIRYCTLLPLARHMDILRVCDAVLLHSDRVTASYPRVPRGLHPPRACLNPMSKLSRDPPPSRALEGDVSLMPPFCCVGSRGLARRAVVATHATSHASIEAVLLVVLTLVQHKEVPADMTWVMMRAASAEPRCQVLLQRGVVTAVDEVLRGRKRSIDRELGGRRTQL